MARIACIFSVELYGTVDRPLRNWRVLPYGLSLIAACLEQAGHEVRCWVLCPATKLEHVAEEIVRNFNCDMLAATAVSTQFPLISQFCQQVKRLKPELPVLLGGTHTSLSPDTTIVHPEFDAICLGEGEKAALAFAQAIDLHQWPTRIPGLWIKRPGSAEIDRTPSLPFETDLDALPLINLKHWERWVDPEDRSFRIVIGRGCPYGCTYCSNHMLRKVTTGRYLRHRSSDNILLEIHRLVSLYPEIDHLYLEIETIAAIPAFAIELCDRLAEFNASRTRPLEFRANVAVSHRLAQNEADMDALLAAFRRANLIHVNVGLESGSETIRRQILNRPDYTNADLIAFCRKAKSYGINISLYILIGLPTETAADFLETARIARACQPADISESIFYPYPGTKLFDLAVDMHLFDPSAVDTRAERSRANLRLQGFPQWRIAFEYVFITWRVFHGRWETSKLAKRMAFKALGMAPGLLAAILRVRHAFAAQPRSPLGAAEIRVSSTH